VQLVDPVATWYVPAAHRVHVLAPASEYCPAAQTEHAADEEPYLPAGQDTHAVEPTEERDPLAQLMQVDELVAPVVGE